MFLYLLFRHAHQNQEMIYYFHRFPMAKIGENLSFFHRKVIFFAIMFRTAVIIFLIAPLVEIALFIELGSAIGLGWTILCIIVSALLGLGLLRWQGIDNFRRTRKALQRGEVPLVEMLDRFFLTIAGIVLFLPGFLTDALGLLLFLPPLRRWVIRQLLSRVQARRERDNGGNGAHGDSARVIETSYHVENETKE